LPAFRPGVGCAPFHSAKRLNSLFPRQQLCLSLCLYYYPKTLILECVTDLGELGAHGLMFALSFENDPNGKKDAWRCTLLEKLKDLSKRAAANQLPASQRRALCYKNSEGPFDANAGESLSSKNTL
jgi:hypothetical protein